MSNVIAGVIGQRRQKTSGIRTIAAVVSRWALDGTAEDSHDVSDGTFFGNPTLGQDPLQSSGESVLFDGSNDYMTVPHVSAYALGEWAFHMKIQPSSTPSGNRVLFSKGTLLPNGEISIEHRPDGLNAYVSQDSVPFWHGPGGGTSAAVALPVGIACDVVLQGGPGGTELWHRSASGSPIAWTMVGSSAAEVGLTANTGNIYIGASAYGGGSGFFAGFIDEVSVWARKLSLAELNALPVPVSVSGPATQELTVPSLAEWLVSDEADPGTITKYVSNANRGNASGSSAANAQEVQAALNSASAGQTFLAVCQTAGTVEHWNYPNGLNFPNGTSGNYITLQARQGDGIVISAGHDFAGARTPNTGYWTQSGLSADDISKKIWRSVSAVGGASSMMGFWVEFDHVHQLLNYGDLTNLRAAYGTDNSPTNYAGPGVYKDSGGVIYIRMQRPHPGKYSFGNKWSSTAWPGHPEAVSGGQQVYPISENPNSYSIHLFRASSTTYGFQGSTAGSSASWIKVGAGINSMGFKYTIRGSNTWMDRGTHLCWHIIMFSATGNTRTNMFFNRCRFSDGSKQHLCRAEWKFGGWLESIRSVAFSMVNSDTMDNIYWKDCTIADFHEIFTGVNRANRIRMRNCTFFNILDDGWQANQNTHRFEIGWCYYRSAAYGGMGVGGSEGDATTPGEVFFHHNVIDCRFETGSDWRGQPHPRYPYLPHSPDGRSPWKIYNNIVLYGPDCEEEQGCAFMHCPSITDNTLTGTTNMHEAFNNIILRVFVEGTKRYDPSSYSLNLLDQSDYVHGSDTCFVRYSADFSNELMDYNCYWRSAGMTVDPMFKNYVRGRNQSSTNHSTLAAWKAHAEFDHSKLAGTYRGAYSAGFDGNSTESKPTLPAIDNYPTDRFKYRPSPTSVVTTAASSSLSGANWWTTPPSWGATYFAWADGSITLAPSAWKGALDPNGSTLLVGVQDP